MRDTRARLASLVTGFDQDLADLQHALDRAAQGSLG